MLCLSWEDKADSDKNHTVIKLKPGQSMFRGRVVLPFLCEAIEKEMNLSIAAPLIEIFSRQEARRCCCSCGQCVFSQFFLVWMPSPQDGNWSKEEKMSEPLRDDEATPYGYTVP